jgi:peptide/nickel transport system ATP-binding protein
MSGSQPIARARDLRAYYRLGAASSGHEVRAVDDVGMEIRRGEIYGIAGESSSGKSTLIRTIAGALAPPLHLVGGSVTYHFGGKDIDVYRLPPRQRRALRWTQVSYVMQGSMNVLNPVRRVRRSFIDFAYAACRPVCWIPIPTNSRAACANASPLPWPRSRTRRC